MTKACSSNFLTKVPTIQNEASNATKSTWYFDRSSKLHVTASIVFLPNFTNFFPEIIDFFNFSLVYQVLYSSFFFVEGKYCKLLVYMDVSENSGFSPQIHLFSPWVFHYKSSIFGGNTPIFLNFHPYIEILYGASLVPRLWKSTPAAPQNQTTNVDGFPVPFWLDETGFDYYFSYNEPNMIYYKS